MGTDDARPIQSRAGSPATAFPLAIIACAIFVILGYPVMMGELIEGQRPTTKMYVPAMTDAASGRGDPFSNQKRRLNAVRATRIIELLSPDGKPRACGVFAPIEAAQRR